MVYQKPYTFRAGTYAKASEMNANFDTLKNFVDDLATDIQDGLESSAAYNKANKNGSSSEKFQVADGTSTNDAINKGQLDTLQTSLNTRISALEALSIVEAPDYSTYTTVNSNSIIANSGWLYVCGNTNSYATVNIDGTDIYLYRGIILPVKSGTTVGSTTNVAYMRLFT